MAPRNKTAGLAAATADLPPDQVEEFMHFVRQRRIGAHHNHEKLRGQIEAHEKHIRTLTEEAAKEMDIITRCDLILGDVPRQAPVLEQRNTGE